MQNRLTVRGLGPGKSIPCVCGIEVENEEDVTTFTAASEEDMKRLKRILAFEIADSITNDYEEKRLEHYIEAAHPYFLPGERREILASARDAVQKMPKDARIQYIEKRLYHFLSHSAKLSLDGFVQFRLKEYTALLERAASAAVDVYLAEREYAEFITLLKLFVSTQPSLEAAVHVCAGKTGKYRLFGRDGEEIEKAAYADLTDIETLTEEDVLLSVLITLAPREITFHGVQNIGNVRLLETVMKVFDGKVHICEMCTLCKNACER